MRRLLVDHARARGRLRRGADPRQITLAHSIIPADQHGLDSNQFLELEAALRKLERLDPRQAKVVELRFFAGLTVAEVADLLDVSKRTVEGDWKHARAWLRRELA